MTEEQEKDSSRDVAVIGMAGRFPGARNLEDFWANLRDGVETISRISEEEALAAGVPPDMLKHPNYVNAHGVMEGADLFDAEFFGFNPREAEAMDPQHRIFLECAWEALENAGYTDAYDGSIGVFSGASMNSYLLHNLIPNRDVLATVGSYQMMIGNDKDFVPTRVSYKLNIKGPSVAIQTACSTSLVAIQMACQSLLTFQSDMVLAGGISLIFPENAGYLYQEGMILSPDGHCRVFDERAQGTVPGSGVGIVVLKRLNEALEDGDTIHAVVKGGAINNDGSGKVGYTAPSVDGQAEAIAMAQAVAGVKPETITYVEAHGTGTPLGDPIEMAALTQVFRDSTSKKQFCAIGSVKTNIGHLDAAAGVAGFVKTVLALKHKVVPPSLHFSKPNPQIDFENSPFFVSTHASEWKTEGTARRAGVSSFGIGGTNAHVVLEEAPEPAASLKSRDWNALVLSTRSAEALDATTVNLAEYLRAAPELDLADASYTLQVGRKAFTHRRAFVCGDRQEALEALANPSGLPMVIQEMDDRPVAFMFSGQGSQYVGMGAELYQKETIFRAQFDYCARILQPHIDCDLRSLLYGPQASATELNQTRFAQPALFSVEYALAKLWMAWGVEPQVMIGHSIGEYTAACLAGVFSLEDALEVVALRGRIMQELPGGSMLAVPLAPEDLSARLGEKVALAAVNGPAFCTVSGQTEHVSELEARLKADGVETRALHTSHAFHSAMMDPILEGFTEKLRNVRLSEPEIPYVSNLSGTWITSEQVTDPGYWASHLRNTVCFADGVRELLEEPGRVLLEVGPGNVLCTFARQTAAPVKKAQIHASLPHPKEGGSDAKFALSSLCRLWQCGVNVNWGGLHSEERLRRVALPTYPFERKRFWVDPKPAPVQQAANAPLVKTTDIANWFYTPSWKRVDLDPVSEVRELLSQDCQWLVFAHAGSLSSAVVGVLEKAGRQVLVVREGEAYSNHGDGNITINATRREDYLSLLSECQQLHERPIRVLHLWNVTSPEPGEIESDLERSQALGFYSLLYLSQALGETQVSQPVRVVVVADGLFSVLGEETLVPQKATLLGPAKVMPQEYANVRCRTVDLPGPQLRANAVSEEPEWIARRILAEFCSADDEVVAFRGKHRWCQTFEPVKVADPGESTPRIREGGVYLVTGGLGGIGLVVSRFLAETARAKLVLTGRSSIPARVEWEEYLGTHGDDDATSTKIRKVQALETAGAEVLVGSADVADATAMQAVFAEATRRFGPIQGVVHAAGLPGRGGLMQLKTQDMAERVLAAKVRGTLVLESLLQGQELDFLVLFSSIDSVYGDFGGVDYCGANAFLDAFASSRARGNGNLTLSINWDVWQEVGMAANAVVPASLQEWKAERLKNGISSEEGIEALRRVLSTSLPQVVISTKDVRRVFEGMRAFAAAQSESGDPASGSTASSEPLRVTMADGKRPELSVELVAPRNEYEEMLVAIWGDLLGIGEIGVQDDFFELGGHSLLGTQVLSRIQESFKIKLPLRALFESPTVAELAERVQTVLWATQGGGSPTEAAGGEVEELEF